MFRPYSDYEKAKKHMVEKAKKYMVEKAIECKLKYVS